MIHLLIVYERMMPTIAAIMSENDRMFCGESIVRAEYIEAAKVTKQTIERADVISLVRPENSPAYRIAVSAKKAGKPVIVFCDDDLLDIPVGVRGTPWRKRILRKTIELADCIESPSRFLAEKYAAMTNNGKYYVPKTVVYPSDMALIQKKKNGGPVKLVYAAGTDHVVMFNKYILPLLPELGEKYGNSITLTFVGVHPDIDECNKYVKTYYKAGMGLLEYRQYMRDNAFDIGLAPLEDTPFNRCKHYNKFIEYTLVGVTGVYSNIPPYVYVVRDEEEGFLTENTPESWLSKISQAIDDEKKRRQCLDNAVQYLRNCHSPEAIRKDQEEHLAQCLKKEVSVEVKHNAALCRMEYSIQRAADLSYLTLATLRHDGVKEVINKIKDHTRAIRQR